MPKITMSVQGFRKAARNLQLLNEHTRRRVKVEISNTTMLVAERARAKAPVSDGSTKSRKAAGRPGPGELRASIRPSVSVSGLVGYVLAGYGKLPRRSRATRPKKLGPMRLPAFLRAQKRAELMAATQVAVYAMAVEYGAPHRGVAEEPYLRPALEGVRASHYARIAAALEGAVSDVASDSTVGSDP